MDRSLKRGTLGLSLLWLARPGVDKLNHATLKQVYSQEDRRLDRHERRADFREQAGKLGGLRAELLDTEMELRGGEVEEPPWLRCSDVSLK